MNKEIPKKDSDEEVDLGQIFNAIGRLFEKFFRLIGSFFKAIFSLIILFLKIVFDYIIVIAVVVGLAFVVGIFTENYKKPVYEASMLVKPYFDSKYQLISSIDYFNSLLNEKRHEVLGDIFDISGDDAESLTRFNVEKGPETKNDLLRQYDKYLKSLDSVRAKNVTYADFVENRDIYSSETYLINVKSHKRDIFRKLEGSFDSIFSNSFSIEQKKKRDMILEVKKASFEKDLENMDTLQAVYMNVIQKQSERGNGDVTVQGLLPLQQEKFQTKEFEVLLNEMRIRDSIKELEQMKIEENSYYEILSRFPEVGKRASKIYTKDWVLFPVLAFMVLCIIYVILAIYKYVKNYE